MSDTHWLDIERVLDCVLDHPVVKWAEAVEAACGGDRDLIRSVESLLRHASALDGYLEEPAARVTALLHQMREERERLGERLGPWRIEEEIGRGGMGVVYRGVRDDGHYQQAVAVKLLRSSSDAVGAARRFSLERQVLADLHHPGIARLLDGGVTEDERPFLVMEYVEGEPLDAYCDRRALRIEARLGLFLEACEAVAYAHRHLVVHRDLKPGNILVTEEDGRPRIKLLDFGIAKLLEVPGARAVPERTALTQPMQRPFTPEYAAPEQVEGRAATTATDVYGLGVVLFELLTGRRPFRFDPSAPRAIERAILVDTPAHGSTVAPKERRRRIAGDLDAIVAKALRKEPESRYENARAFADDVRRHVKGLPVEARKGAAGYLVRKFVRRHRVGVGITAAAFALLTVTTVALGVQAARLEQAIDAAEVDAARAREVSELLAEIFQMPSADNLFTRTAFTRTAIDSITARDITERGLQRAQSGGVDPAVQGQLLHTIGVVNANRHDFQEALTLFERALSLRSQAHGATSSEAGETHSALGRTLSGMGLFEEAEPHLRQAVAIGLNSTSRGTAFDDALLMLAGQLIDRGAIVEAEVLARDNLALANARYHPEHLFVAEAQSIMAAVLLKTDRFEEAEPLLRQAFQTKQSELGEDHMATLETLRDLAATVTRRGDHAGAVPLKRRLAEGYRRTLGNHRFTADAHRSLGSSLAALAELDDAESAYRVALRIYEGLGGVDDVVRTEDERVMLVGGVGVAAVQRDLADVMRRQGDDAGAVPLLLEALRLQLQYGWDTATHGVARLEVGNVLFALGRFREAGDQLIQSEALLADTTYFERHRAIFGRPSPITRAELARHHRRALSSLVDLYDTTGEAALADAYERLAVGGGLIR